MCTKQTPHNQEWGVCSTCFVYIPICTENSMMCEYMSRLMPSVLVILYIVT